MFIPSTKLKLNAAPFVQAFNISEDLQTASSLITDNSDLLLAPKETILEAQVRRLGSAQMTVVCT